MSSLRLTIILLIINTVIAFFVALFAFIKRNKTFLQMAFVILVCPLVGPVFYSMSYLIYHIFLRKNAVDLSDVSFSKDQVDKIQMPDYEEETAIIPLEEALLISNKSDRRQSILNKLKRDYDDNISTIMKAVENEDGETSHYAASVILNVNSDFLLSIKERALDYERNPGDFDINRAYIDTLFNYVSSGILGEIEKKKYLYTYLEVLKNFFSLFPNSVTEVDFENAVIFCNYLLNPEESLWWCKVCMACYSESEVSYLNYLKTYYQLEYQDKFFEYLNALKNSPVMLTQQGLELIRFFDESVSLSV